MGGKEHKAACTWVPPDPVWVFSPYDPAVYLYHLTIITLTPEHGSMLSVVVTVWMGRALGDLHQTPITSFSFSKAVSAQGQGAYPTLISVLSSLHRGTWSSAHGAGLGLIAAGQFDGAGR